MNRTALKIIACVSMLLDHVGYFLFPGVTALRALGRLAFPLFAFFIGEGARYTHDRKRYILQLGLLGAVCQLVYVAEDIITAGRLTVSSGCWFFNILLTFTLAAAACFLLLDAKAGRDAGHIIPFIIYITVISGMMLALRQLRVYTPSSFSFDYGICGVLLPLSAVIADEKKEKLCLFSAATLFYCFVFCREMPYVWFSLAALPLLIAYNGKSGSKKFKYWFYAFYPAHLGIIYLISEAVRYFY